MFTTTGLGEQKRVMLRSHLLSQHARALAAAVLGAAILAGCGGESGTEPDRAPTITVTGVTDGAVVTGSVTIQITVDVGTYSATLNGEEFFSGRTVIDPGLYTLVVTARNGTATASETVGFTIELAGPSRLIIRVFDLGPNEAGGGGDALLLTDSSAAGLRHALIDAGPAGVDGADPGFVGRRLEGLGVDTLEALVLTHAHSDHFGGMGSVLQDVVVRRFYYNDQVRDFAAYNQVIALASQWADTVIVPDAVVELTLGFGVDATRLRILTPLSAFLGNANASSSEINDGSLGTEVEKGVFRFFLAGDGEVAANQRWRSAFGSATADLTALKVGHHGANDAVFDNGFNGASAWLAHTAPELALISANGTTHPRQNAIAALLAVPGLDTWCTSTHGDIEVRVGDGGQYVTTVEENASDVCEPGTDATT
jgi:beta-lactamase superfamily II metal-dependent hydrolase